MARYRKERRARLAYEHAMLKRDKAWRKRIRRERRALLPPTAEPRTFLGRFIRRLLGGD